MIQTQFLYHKKFLVFYFLTEKVLILFQRRPKRHLQRRKRFYCLSEHGFGKNSCSRKVWPLNRWRMCRKMPKHCWMYRLCSHTNRPVERISLIIKFWRLNDISSFLKFWRSITYNGDEVCGELVQTYFPHCTRNGN